MEYPTGSQHIYSTESATLYTVKEVSDYVNEGAKTVAACAGKELVIFIGPSQVGKSTTINALLGGKFRKTVFGKLEMTEPPPVKAASMGGTDLGGGSETRFPSLYSVEGVPFSFLDTRGFFDTNRDESGSVASSILLEMAVRLAKTVRIVSIISCQSLADGLSGVMNIGHTLSKIVTQRVPIYFLFNKYDLTSSDSTNPIFIPTKKTTDSSGCDVFTDEQEEAQNAHIRNQIQQMYAHLCTGNTKRKLNFMKQLAHRLNLHEAFDSISSKPEEEITEEEAEESVGRLFEKIETDPASLEALQDQQRDDMYIELIGDSLRASPPLFGFIDPLQPQSVARLLHQLRYIPTVNPSFLVFPNSNADRFMFDRHFERLLSRELVLLKRIQFALKYANILPSLLQTVRKKYDKALETEAKVKIGTTPDTPIQELVEASTIEAELNQIEKQLNETKAQIHDLETGPNERQVIVYHEGNRKMFGWICVPVRYPKLEDSDAPPFVDIEIDSPGFIPYKVYHDEPPYRYMVDWATGGSVKKALHHISEGVKAIISPLIRLFGPKKKPEQNVVDKQGDLVSAVQGGLDNALDQDIETVYLKVVLIFKLTEKYAPYYNDLKILRDSLQNQVYELSDRRHVLTLSADKRVKRERVLLEQDLMMMQQAENMVNESLLLWKGRDPAILYPSFSDRMQSRCQFVTVAYPSEGGKNPIEHQFYHEYTKTIQTSPLENTEEEDLTTAFLAEYKTLCYQDQAAKDEGHSVAFVAHPPPPHA